MVRRRVPKKRILLTDEEKAQLIELGQAIGPALKHLLTIVNYETYRRWVRNAESDSPKPSSAQSERFHRKMGAEYRPRMLGPFFGLQREAHGLSGLPVR